MLRESNSLAARLFLLGRHGRRRATRIAHERLDDVLLLLVAVAIALVIRGVPRHQVLGGLEDAGWAAVAVLLYLPIVFAVGAVSAWRALRRWEVSHTNITHGVILELKPAARGITPYEGRCVVECEDHSRHAAVVFPVDETGYLRCHYNSAFPSTGLQPPRGHHAARWFIKESPLDGWIAVAEDRFTYSPGVPA